MGLDYVDLFGGPGGWDVAASSLGLLGYGIDNDPVVRETREAAGLGTLLDDVRNHKALDHPTEGLIASPPCQTFSQAGRGTGHRALEEVRALALQLDAGEPYGWVPEDPRTLLILEPLRWVLEALEAGTPYRWVALEQVATVLPVWQVFAEVLASRGYGVAYSLVQAEEYGVPQTRRRALLVARYRDLVTFPTPTHQRYHHTAVRGAVADRLPWVTMASALGWVGPDDWITQVRDQTGTPVDLSWPLHRPSTTVSTRDLVQHPGSVANRFQPGVTKSRNDGIRLTVNQAARIQTFPEDYPFAGPRTAQHKQIGNAIPVRLARVVLAALTNTPEEQP